MIPNEMEPEDTEEVLAESGKNMESAIAYAEKMISQAIDDSGTRIPETKTAVF